MAQVREGYEDFAQWFQVRFRRVEGRDAAVSTIRSKGEHLSMTARALGVPQRTHNLIECLNTRDAVEALLDRLSLAYAPGTMRGIVSTLVYLSAYAKMNGAEIPITAKDAPPVRIDGNREIYSREEIETLLTGSKVLGFRYHLFLLTLIDTGIRLSEALNFTYANLHMGETPYMVLDYTKSRKPQVVPFSSRLASLYASERLEALKTDKDTRRGYSKPVDTYIFPWTEEAARARVKTLCERLEVPYRNIHAFRHTFATHKLQDGVPVHAVSKLLRHSSVLTTQAFYDHSTELDFAHYLG